MLIVKRRVEVALKCVPLHPPPASPPIPGVIANNVQLLRCNISLQVAIFTGVTGNRKLRMRTCER